MASRMPAKILLYVLRHDLRFTDNPVLREIQKSFESGNAGFTHVLPIYVFPAHQVEISGFIPVGDDASSTPKSPYPEARSKVARFWRCGPHRAKFLAESVWDLKVTLEEKNSRLLIRVGQITDVLNEMFQHLQKSHGQDSKQDPSSADAQITDVWMTKDYGFEERQEEDDVQKVVEKVGARFRAFTDEKYYVHEYVQLLLAEVSMKPFAVHWQFYQANLLYASDFCPRTEILNFEITWSAITQAF